MQSIPTTNDYILNWVSVIFLVVWYFCMASQECICALRSFVFSPTKRQTEPRTSKLADDELRASVHGHSAFVQRLVHILVEYILPYFEYWMRIFSLLSLLFIPFVLVTAPHDSSFEVFVSSILRMALCMVLPCLLFSIRIDSSESRARISRRKLNPCRCSLQQGCACSCSSASIVQRCCQYHLDLLFELLALASIWLPWQLNLLPVMTCSLSRFFSFPVSHLLMVDTVIFVLRVVFRLRRVGFNFAPLLGSLVSGNYSHAQQARLHRLTKVWMMGVGVALVCSIPFGLHTGLLVFHYDSSNVLIDHLAKFFEIYFLISIVEEILFRGLVQNLMERRLDLLFPPATKKPDQVQKQHHIQSFDAMIQQQQEENSYYDSSSEDEFESGTQKELNNNNGWMASYFLPLYTKYVRLPSKNALIALILSSFIYGFSHLHLHWQRYATPPQLDRFLITFFMGLVYGWVWRKTKHVTLSGLTNAMTTFTWFLFFSSNPSVL